jgi:hypothetical protein
VTASINTRPLMVLRLATSPTQDVGSTPEGALMIFPVVGGSFEGEPLRGTVLAGGGDWVTRRSNGMMTLDLRITLETDDGSLTEARHVRAGNGGMLAISNAGSAGHRSSRTARGSRVSTKPARCPCRGRLVCELQRDYARTETVGAFMKILFDPGVPFVAAEHR